MQTEATIDKPQSIQRFPLENKPDLVVLEIRNSICVSICLKLTTASGLDVSLVDATLLGASFYFYLDMSQLHVGQNDFPHYESANPEIVRKC